MAWPLSMAVRRPQLTYTWHKNGACDKTTMPAVTVGIKQILAFSLLECGKEAIQLRGDRGSFTSPGGYEGYANDTTCR